MIQTIKILAIILATIVIIGAGIGLGVVLGSLILGVSVSRNSSVRSLCGILSLNARLVLIIAGERFSVVFEYLKYAYFIVIGIQAVLILASLILGLELSFDISYLNNLINYINVEWGGNVMLLDDSETLFDDYETVMPMPGVKCPTCAARGLEQWVLPGKHCPRCSTAC